MTITCVSTAGIISDQSVFPTNVSNNRTNSFPDTVFIILALFRHCTITAFSYYCKKLRKEKWALCKRTSAVKHREGEERQIINPWESSHWKHREKRKPG